MEGNPFGRIDSYGLEKITSLKNMDVNRWAVQNAFDPPNGIRDINHGSDGKTFNSNSPLRNAQIYAGKTIIQKRLKEGKPIIIIMDGCEVGTNGYVEETYKGLIATDKRFEKVDVWQAAPTTEVRSFFYNFERQWTYNWSFLNPFVMPDNKGLFIIGKWKLYKNGIYQPQLDYLANPNKDGKNNPIFNQ